MDISTTGQKILTYLYQSIFVEAEKWNFIDPTINGIDCGRWAVEKGIDAHDLITTLDDLYAAGFIRILLFDGALDAGLMPCGIEFVEARGLAAPDVIAHQQAARARILETLAKHRKERPKGMRTADIVKEAGVTRFAVGSNAWYLDRIGSIKHSKTRLKITNKGTDEVRRKRL